MKTITSNKNPLIQRAKSLQTAKGRKAEQAYWLDGEHMVSEAIAYCSADIEAVYVAEEKVEHYKELLEKLPDTAMQYSIPMTMFTQIAQVKTPQGISAICTLPEMKPISTFGKKLVLLENVQDPGNVGTILRTMDAAGFDGALLSEGCADPYSAKVLRSTMGSIFRVPVHFISNVAQTVEELNKQGYTTIASCLQGEAFYERDKVKTPLCVLVGNEGAGLSETSIQACTNRYKLPMLGGSESLNVAIATAIFLYDLSFGKTNK